MAECHEVTLVWGDGGSETIRVYADETVVEATRRQDLIVPVGCTSGTCGTCAGRLIDAAFVGPTDHPESAFEYRRPPGALRSRHRRQGYVLLCLAEPRTDCRLAVGAATRSSELEFPWDGGGHDE